MPDAFAAVLLVGGRSARMGRDKAFLPLRSERASSESNAGCATQEVAPCSVTLPLWQMQLEKLYLLGPERLVISARREQGFADRVCEMPESVELLEDPPGDELGPLGAVARCVGHVAMPALVLAVDLPLMTVDFLRQLANRARPGRGLAPRTARAYEPLAAWYVPEMLPVLRAGMAGGDLSFQHALSASVRAGVCDEVMIAAGDEGVFRNVNTPGDWESLPIRPAGA